MVPDPQMDRSKTMAATQVLSSLSGRPCSMTLPYTAAQCKPVACTDNAVCRVQSCIMGPTLLQLISSCGKAR